MKKGNVKTGALAALIGALYCAVTLLSVPFGLAIGPFEIRLSETLVCLPIFTPAAVPGLTLGCLLANLLAGGHILDIIFGTLATLLGALGTRLFRSRPAPALACPILANTLIVPPILYFAYGFQSSGFLFLLITFFVGETLSAGVLGYFLQKALRPFQSYFQ